MIVVIFKWYELLLFEFYLKDIFMFVSGNGWYIGMIVEVFLVVIILVICVVLSIFFLLLVFWVIWL